jgi:RNA polymerase sigma-70 factor (ECF subfamily)
VDDSTLRSWFCNQVLPLEPALTAYIRRRWRWPDDVTDIRQEIYERALAGAKTALPGHTSGYRYAIARNHIANRARQATIVSFELMSDLDQDESPGSFQPERELISQATSCVARSAASNCFPIAAARWFACAR